MKPVLPNTCPALRGRGLVVYLCLVISIIGYGVWDAYRTWKPLHDRKKAEAYDLNIGRIELAALTVEGDVSVADALNIYAGIGRIKEVNKQVDEAIEIANDIIRQFATQASAQKTDTRIAPENNERTNSSH